MIISLVIYILYNFCITHNISLNIFVTLENVKAILSSQVR